MTDRKLYVYDCDMGQGLVAAPSLAEAERQARLEAGRAAGARNVRVADEETVEWHRAMGGYVPEVA